MIGPSSAPAGHGDSRAFGRAVDLETAPWDGEWGVTQVVQVAQVELVVFGGPVRRSADQGNPQPIG